MTRLISVLIYPELDTNSLGDDPQTHHLVNCGGHLLLKMEENLIKI